MEHVELHKDLSDVFKRLKTGQLKPQLAKEIFNGAGKMINLCRNELVAVQMGIDIEIPLLGIKKGETRELKGRGPGILKGKED